MKRILIFGFFLIFLLVSCSPIILLQQYEFDEIPIEKKKPSKSKPKSKPTKVDKEKKKEIEIKEEKKKEIEDTDEKIRKIEEEGNKDITKEIFKKIGRAHV